MLLVAYGLPGIQVVAVLGTVDDPLGVALVVSIVAAFGIVVAHDVDGIGIGCLVGHHHAGQCSCGGTRRINALHDGCQSLGNAANALGIRLFGLVAAVHGLGEACAVAVKHRVRVGVVGIVHLVAYRPEEDTGVAAVAPHHVGHVAVNPLLEISVGALEAGPALVPSLQPLALGKLPLVGGFVHHEHALLVADVIQFGSMGIMAHADGIGADGLQLPDAAAPHLGGYSRA